jgi:hypothetical protein
MYKVRVWTICRECLVNRLFIQAAEIVAVKAKVDEMEGQKAAFEDHITTLKVMKNHEI